VKRVIIAALLCVAVGSANAAVIQYSFTGSVTNDHNSQINLGETFTLSFLIDSDAPGFAINDYVQYDIISGTIEFSGGYSGSFGGAEFKVTNDRASGSQAGYDILSLFVYTFYDVSGMPANFGSDFNNMDFRIWDSSGTALSDGSIPTSLNLGDWDGSEGGILWDSPTLRHNDLDGVVAYVGAPVPVPAAVWLFGSALFGLGWTRRRLGN